jgi:O-antigen ligase
MASMDIHKDAEGFQKLNKNDIRAIEKGCASVHHHGIMARVYGLQFQFNNVDNPNGHSFLQRLEFWKTGVQLAQKNWLIGVGNGDVQLAFHKQYALNNSKLEFHNQKRTHNMYLTILIGIGIIGLLLLLFSHVGFLIANFKNGQLIAVLFMIIVLLSYFMEDTLETQTGVTFFALFYGLFSTLPRKGEQVSK